MCWTIYLMNCKKERDKIIILQAKNSPIFDKWDQTEQILKETIKTS